MKKTQHKRAIILDRDGVLIQRADLTWKINQIRLAPNIINSIKYFNSNKIPIVVITNQPVIARGWISEKGVDELHEILQKRLNKQGAYIDKFYICPHHPNANIKKYRKKCNCRKPKIGLYTKMAKELNINLNESIMIGDMTQDILAGNKAGCKTILLTNAGHGGRDKKFNVIPDYTSHNLSTALTKIQKMWFNL